MSGPSLFRQVTKYVPAAFGNPRENRLTEVTAAVLTRCPEYRQEFARRLLELAVGRLGDGEGGTNVVALRALHAATSDVSFGQPRTQVPVARRFVDLELPVEGTNTCLWIEVKHGAPESGDQVKAYLDRVAGTGHRPLVIMAPRGFATSHADVPAVAWQSVAETLDDPTRYGDGELARLLLQEFRAYLREEYLMDVPLTSDHVDALTWGAEARETLKAIRNQLATELAPYRDGEPHTRSGEFWVPCGVTGRGTRWWGIGRANDNTDGPQRFVFLAGLAFDRGVDPFLDDSHREWLASMKDARFDEDPREGEASLYRVLELSKLTTFGSIDAQVRHVKGWIEQAFRDLDRLALDD